MNLSQRKEISTEHHSHSVFPWFVFCQRHSYLSCALRGKSAHIFTNLNNRINKNRSIEFDNDFKSTFKFISFSLFSYVSHHGLAGAPPRRIISRRTSTLELVFFYPLCLSLVPFDEQIVTRM